MFQRSTTLRIASCLIYETGGGKRHAIVFWLTTSTTALLVLVSPLSSSSSSNRSCAFMLYMLVPQRHMDAGCSLAVLTISTYVGRSRASCQRSSEWVVLIQVRMQTSLLVSVFAIWALYATSFGSDLQQVTITTLLFPKEQAKPTNITLPYLPLRLAQVLDNKIPRLCERTSHCLAVVLTIGESTTNTYTPAASDRHYRSC